MEKLQSDIWTVADKNNDGQVEIEELVKSMSRVNLIITKKDIQSLLLGNGTSTVDRQQFQKVFETMSNNSEVEALFRSIAASPGNSSKVETMDESVFVHKFLRDIQKHSPAQIDRIKAKYVQNGKITAQEFKKYFSSEDASIINYEKSKTIMDMTRPWTHYFINSSHNTYLTGDQLSSDSSVDCYVTALKSGCRCVELDCWDGPNNSPIVYHGYTLTSKILFEDIIKAVKVSAFIASEYPVILSLENHCSSEQQKEMARIMRDILGDLLVTQAVNGDDSPPSPEQLKRRILIKAKGLPSHNNIPSSPIQSDDEFSDFEDAEGPTIAEKPERQQDAHSKIVPELAELAVYMKAKKCHQLADALKSFRYENVSSFSEVKAGNLIRKNYMDFLKFNSIAFSRIYPKGSRIDSSNILPVEYWQAGAQLAALNYQTFDKGSQINTAMFKYHNDGLGYVLKPKYMTDITAESAVPEHWKLKVTVLSGFLLPKPEGNSDGEVIDPYVSVELITPMYSPSSPLSPVSSTGSSVMRMLKRQIILKKDSIKSSDTESTVIIERYKTEAIDDNGFNPVWHALDSERKILKKRGGLPHEHSHKFINGDMMQFKTAVDYPELSFLKFLIKDEDVGQDDFVAVGVVPLSVVQTGYRNVSLWDFKGRELPYSNLLVYLSFDQ